MWVFLMLQVSPMDQDSFIKFKKLKITLILQFSLKLNLLMDPFLLKILLSFLKIRLFIVEASVKGLFMGKGI
jgi:hypothetical protein